jgi:hypothetical protein
MFKIKRSDTGEDPILALLNSNEESKAEELPLRVRGDSPVIG